METPLSPQPGQDPKGQGQPNNDTGGGAAQKHGDVSPLGQSDNSFDVVDVINIGAGLIIVVIAVALDSAGYHILAFLCDFAAVGMGLWLIFIHHMKRTRFRKWATHWFCITMILNAILFIFLSLHSIRGELAAESPKQPILVTQPDFIEGTAYTRKRLEEIFPFGYAVIFYGQNQTLRKEVHKTGKLEWNLDVDNIKIEPDVSSGRVTWTIPIVEAKNDLPSTTPTHNSTTIHGGMLGTTGTFKTGIMGRAGFMVAGDPMVYVITLSDDQRNPVFAIGFRIPTKEEIGPPRMRFLVAPP